MLSGHNREFKCFWLKKLPRGLEIVHRRPRFVGSNCYPSEGWIVRSKVSCYIDNSLVSRSFQDACVGHCLSVFAFVEEIQIWRFFFVIVLISFFDVDIAREFRVEGDLAVTLNEWWFPCSVYFAVDVKVKKGGSPVRSMGCNCLDPTGWQPWWRRSYW